MAEPIQNFNNLLFAERLEKLYLEFNATPEQLSLFTDCTNKQLDILCKPGRKVSRHIIDAIAEFFEIQPDYLLGIADAPCYKANRAQPVDVKYPELLWKLRDSRHLKPHEVAYFLRFSETTYLSFENGEQEPMLATLINLADYYDVSLDYLTGRTNNPRRL